MGRRARLVIRIGVVAALVAATHTGAMAKNFGTYGAVFPIEEPDFLEEILSRFRSMEDTGELAQMERDMQARTKEYLERPTVAAFLP
jgi:conjugal transfer pilus assembly protein TraW